jgi:hypothetical protein
MINRGEALWRVLEMNIDPTTAKVFSFTTGRILTAEETQALSDSHITNQANQAPEASLKDLSQGNDPFEELTTRLTDFFSKPESENNQAQGIKNACWNNLTEEQKPVFKPDFDNLRTAQFSKSPEGGLTITLSSNHVYQGYLQVLSDLTLVAEVIKRSIYKGAENPIGGFDAKHIEKIKIITHPERNLVIPGEEIVKNNPYEIGPEFKFIKSATCGLIPVANGMFNLDDFITGKLRTPNNNNSHLEPLAFNSLNKSLNDAVLQLFELQRPYLTAQNKIHLTPLNTDSYGYEITMDAFGYKGAQTELLTLLGKHNNGDVFTDTSHQRPRDQSLEVCHLDPKYTISVREMSRYKPDEQQLSYHHHGRQEMLEHQDLNVLSRFDALKAINQGANPRKGTGGTLLPLYASVHADTDRMHEIHRKYEAAGKRRS